MTIHEHIEAAIGACRSWRDAHPEAAREFALAITALEDAQGRSQRGIAQAKGLSTVIDAEREEGAEALRQVFQGLGR